LFNAEFDGYPNSDAMDDDPVTPKNYCGAMKLAEAMVGQDLKGFNPASRFRRSGFGTAAPTPSMPYPALNYPDAATYNENIRSRKMYLQLENANAYQIRDIYDNTAITTTTFPGNLVLGFDPNTYVLCDSYNRVTNKTTGKKNGMPILYYKADSTKLNHPAPSVLPANMQANYEAGAYIYSVSDNQALINMGMPWIANFSHPLASGGMTIGGVNLNGIWPIKFYEITRDSKISTGDRPVRADSYILMSAGFDGEYGTKDDIYNFSD
jgi:hypothetical protein